MEFDFVRKVSGEVRSRVHGEIKALNAEASVGIGDSRQVVVYKLQLQPMIEIKQTETFRSWEARLRDRRARTLIAARVMRLAEGLPGDVAPVGEGVSELRIHHGPGYRIYFQKRGNVLVVLLCGGDKGSQARDIAMAKKQAQEWSEQDG